MYHRIILMLSHDALPCSFFLSRLLPVLITGVIALFPTMCSVRQWESTSHNVSLASGQHKWGWQEGTYLVK
jgi:hypothetical protein